MKKDKIYEDHKEPRFISQEYPTDGVMNPLPAKTSNTWEQP
jgi:hypothetical protein